MQATSKAIGDEGAVLWVTYEQFASERKRALEAEWALLRLERGEFFRSSRQLTQEQLCKAIAASAVVTLFFSAVMAAYLAAG